MQKGEKIQKIRVTIQNIIEYSPTAMLRCLGSTVIMKFVMGLCEEARSIRRYVAVLTKATRRIRSLLDKDLL